MAKDSFRFKKYFEWEYLSTGMGHKNLAENMVLPILLR